MKPSPFTVRVKAGPPAMAEVGLDGGEMTGETVMTGKLTGFEWATPGVDTVMGATPSVATRFTGMVAVNWVELTKMVGSGVRTPLDGGVLREAFTGHGESDGRSAGDRRMRDRG